MEQKLKFAVIGMGNMGRAHAGNLLKMEGVELAAVCSFPIQDAEHFVKENSLSCAVYEDAFRLLEEVSLDGIYLCVPPFAHCGQFEAAAKKGLAVFMEKPIAINMERAASMRQAAKENQIITQVGYHMRFGAAVKRLKELLDTGVAGKPLMYIGRYECNSLHTPWWIDVNKCGGQVFEQVIHLYDMALYLMGKPKAVNGHIANLDHRNVPGYTVEDTSIGMLQFESGALGTITGSNCAVKDKWEATFRVVCQNLVADFTDFNHAEFTFTGEPKGGVETVKEDRDATWEEDLYFVEVMKGEKKPFATIEDGYLGLWMVASVLQSSRQQGNTVMSTDNTGGK